jgi:hypothetical protein
MAQLSDEQLQALDRQYRKVREIKWDDYRMVFRRATRDEVRDYVRKGDDQFSKPNRVNELAQATIVAFDGEADIVRARGMFLSFLDEYPGFTIAPHVGAFFADIMGMVEKEDAAALGKVCSERNTTLASSAKASPNGYATAPAQSTQGPSSAPTAGQPQPS